MDAPPDHPCRYRSVLVWSAWRMAADVLEREGRRVARCAQCGRDRPLRRPRPPLFLEREARVKVDQLQRKGLQAVALAILKGAARERIRVRGLVSAAARAGLPASGAEANLEAMVEAGLLRGRYRLRGTRRALDSVTALDLDTMEELVHPGARAARNETVGAALRECALLKHPIAREAERALEDEATVRKLTPLAVRALSAVARHADAGEVLAERVFSARFLGGSKELRRVRRRIERILGPLEALGIRDGGSVVLLGGCGGIRLGGKVDVDLADVAPYVGLSPETVASVALAPPPEGLLLIENLAAFEAACRREVLGAGDLLHVWSAGYPGQAHQRLVKLASGAGAAVRIWADLDLDGVRIARLIHGWAPGHVQAWRMSGDDVHRSSVRRPLEARARAAIRADLAARPDAFLADTLRALLESDSWVEQETFLGGPRTQGAG
jgi:hypothetical protein